jgi:nucleotide-binding universal stress UspA family protein
MIERMLVAIDGSGHAWRALDLAADLASKYDTSLMVLHVISDRPLSEAEMRMADIEYHERISRDFDANQLLDVRGDVRAMGERLVAQSTETGRRIRQLLSERLLHDAESRARKRGVSKVETMSVSGEPSSTILRMAQQRKVQMIVMGSRGRSDLQGLLLGSTSHKVSQLSTCTCVTVK